MNKPLATIVSALALSMALPALAGPDFQAIEHARQVKRARSGQLTAPGDCRSLKSAMPLDHGPRAQTAPPNGKRKERLEALKRGCGDNARKGATQ